VPYTPPSTVTGSDVLTAALWNTQVKDNLNELRNPPVARVTISSALTSYTGADISWAAAPLNVGSMWSAGSPTRITAPQTGLYLFSFTCNFSTGTGANVCFLEVNKNGNLAASTLAPRVFSGTSPGQVVSGIGVPIVFTSVIRLAQSEYLTFALDSGGANGSGTITPVTVSASSEATVVWLGACP
jgi:hypothetical protein